MTDELIDALAAALGDLVNLSDAGRRAYLSRELAGLRDLSGLLRSAGAAGTPSARVREFQRVESACDRILAAFAISDRHFDLDAAVRSSSIASILAFEAADIVNPRRRQHPPLEDPDTRAGLGEWLRGLTILRDAARRAKEQAERQKKSGLGGVRRRADRPLHELAWHVLRLYIELTGRNPGVSRDPEGGPAGGPAVRFLETVLADLEFSTKSNTAANLINMLKDDLELLRTKRLSVFKTENF